MGRRLSMRWASCALATGVIAGIAIPNASADRSRKSLAACTAFDQADKGDDLVELTIHNTCSVPVDCSISWRLVCAPEAKKRRTSHRGSTNLALSPNTSHTAEASAAACGDDGWVIDSIQWSCEPNRD
ncbi:MAG: hypothetical protein AB7P03_16100 [Kofleriaceae bacterium]